MHVTKLFSWIPVASVNVLEIIPTNGTIVSWKVLMQFCEILFQFECSKSSIVFFLYNAAFCWSSFKGFLKRESVHVLYFLLYDFRYLRPRGKRLLEVGLFQAVLLQPAHDHGIRGRQFPRRRLGLDTTSTAGGLAHIRVLVGGQLRQTWSQPLVFRATCVRVPFWMGLKLFF